MTVLVENETLTFQEVMLQPDLTGCPETTLTASPLVQLVVQIMHLLDLTVVEVEMAIEHVFLEIIRSVELSCLMIATIPWKVALESGDWVVDSQMPGHVSPDNFCANMTLL